MAEVSGVFKTGRKNKKETSRSFMQYGTTPSNDINSGRLTLISGARLQKFTSNSLDTLSFVSETDSSDNSDFENYDLDYSTYLLRHLQSSLLSKNKVEKEEGLKKCFISLKFEWEALLEEYVRLSKDLMYFKIFWDVYQQTSSRIKIGRSILEMLREDNFEVLFKSLSRCLEDSTNQLQLVDISKQSIEDAFAKNILGSGSEIDVCLKSIEASTRNNMEQISKISSELLDIRRLCLENLMLRERCCSIFNITSSKILESNYNMFTEVVKNSFKRRQELSKDEFALDDDDDFFDIQKIFQPKIELANTQQSIRLSKFESPGSLKPKNASTPVPDEKN